MSRNENLRNTKRIMRRNPARRLNSGINDEKEQRRTNRMTALLAIIALMISLATIVIPKVGKLVYLAPHNNRFWFWLAFACATFIVYAIVLVFVDILLTILSELKRYDVVQDTSELCKEVDENYKKLKIDFMVCVGFSAFYALALIPIAFMLSGEGKFSVVAVTIFILIMLAGTILVYVLQFQPVFGVSCGFSSFIRENKSKYIASFVITGSIFFTFLVGKYSSISIQNRNTGEITISNATISSMMIEPKQIHKINVEIISKESGAVVLDRELCAKDGLGFNEKALFRLVDLDGEKKDYYPFFLMDAEKKEKKYLLDLRNENLEEGRYEIQLTIEYGAKEVYINCDFEKNKYNRYTFAKDLLVEKY